MNKYPGRHRIDIVVDDDVLEELKWYCRETGCNRTGAIVHALKEYIDNYRKKISSNKEGEIQL